MPSAQGVRRRALLAAASVHVVVGATTANATKFNQGVDVKPIPGPRATAVGGVWFHETRRWREASAAARESASRAGRGRPTRHPGRAEERGYEEVRRYVIGARRLRGRRSRPARVPARDLRRSALTSWRRSSRRARLVPRPTRPLGAPARGLRTGGSGCSIRTRRRRTSSRRGRPRLGYGFLSAGRGCGTGSGIARRADGVATAIKRGQLAWAKAHAVPTLRTANETRLVMLEMNRRLGYRRLYDDRAARALRLTAAN